MILNMTGGTGGSGKSDIIVTAPTGSTVTCSQDTEVKEVYGEAVQITDSAAAPVKGLTLCGKSTQDGTPTPEAPVEIVSVGDDGNITITASDSGDNSNSATVTNDSHSDNPIFPLRGIRVPDGVADADAVMIDGQPWITDTLEVNADGSGRAVRNIQAYTFTGNERYLKERDYFVVIFTANIYTRKSSELPILLCSSYPVNSSSASNPYDYSILTRASGEGFVIKDINFTDDVDFKAHVKAQFEAGTPITAIYKAAVPEEIPLTPEEVQAVLALQTYSPVTNVYNDEGAWQKLYYLGYSGAVKNAAEKDGVWTFKGCGIGTWNVTATPPSGGNPVTRTVVIQEKGQLMRYEVTISYAGIYGIQRDITASSPLWTRTDNAVGFTAAASVGAAAGSSSFDDCCPWSGIARETFSSGDVMVRIPRFWFKRWRDGNVEHIQIADNKVDGFAVHPAFNHAGAETDCIYVGAYKTSNYNRSVSGAAPTTSAVREVFRVNAKNKGAGWGLLDISAISAIQMLMLVEFATNDMQSAIGRGYCDNNSSALNTGSCNNVVNLTGRPSGTDGTVDVVWRGIEGFWGNVWEMSDGVNFKDGTYYVCNDPSQYADDTAAGYTPLSFTGATNWAGSYVTQEGMDTGANGHIMLPAAAGNGSESTFDCDACWSGSGWSVFLHGGVWRYGSSCGLFAADMHVKSNYTDEDYGSRLLYIPQEVSA